MSSNTIYHNHHVIPRHMGGSDDPSNLVKLTVEEHALAHKKLYEEHGLKEDYLAWKGLEGLIGKEEICAEISRKLMKDLIQTKLPCKHCGREISQHNMSRHLYSCTNGKEGIKHNQSPKRLKPLYTYECKYCGKSKTIKITPKRKLTRQYCSVSCARRDSVNRS